MSRPIPPLSPHQYIDPLPTTRAVGKSGPFVSIVGPLVFYRQVSGDEGGHNAGCPRLGWVVLRGVLIKLWWI